jgi:hypothetical protein
VIDVSRGKLHARPSVEIVLQLSASGAQIAQATGDRAHCASEFLIILESSAKFGNVDFNMLRLCRYRQIC